ncbi:hypothetical protein D3C81_793960 [compost metagenome]
MGRGHGRAHHASRSPFTGRPLLALVGHLPDPAIVVLLGVATGCGQVHARPVVGVVGLAAVEAGSADRDDVVARRHRVAAGIAVAVAGRHHDDGAQADGLIDGVLVDGRTGCRTATSQAHVDHFRRRLVDRQARHGAACGPDDAVGNIAAEAAARTQHAHRHHLRLECQAGEVDPVVGVLGDGARDMAAVPRTGIGGVRIGARPAGAVVLLDPVTDVPAADNAVVGGTARHALVADHVVAGNDGGLQVRVALRDAGVDHRHHHAFTLRDIPRSGCVDAAECVVEIPLRRGLRIVRGEVRVLSGHVVIQAIDFHAFHGGVGLQLTDELRRLGRIERPRGLDHRPAWAGHATQQCGARRRTCRRAAHRRHCTIQPRTIGCSTNSLIGPGRITQLAGAGTVLHDESVTALACSRRGIERARGHVAGTCGGRHGNTD